MELFYTTKGIAGAYYTYFEAFSIAMVFYFIMTFICSRILRALESRMDGPDNYELVQTDALVLGEGMHRYNPKDKNVSTNGDYRAQRAGNFNENQREGM